uniref:Uncharacterized protein n=1 Tax=Vitis vinifera TaxID=29760 RepID=A5AMW2_VITVI|nr:hypothetical protein VITISV_038988 [Vitis vinifera]
MGIENLKNPWVPNFKGIPAKMTDPAVDPYNNGRVRGGPKAELTGGGWSKLHLDSRIFCFSGGGEQCSLRCGRCPPVGPGLLPARKNRSLASRTSGGPIRRHTENHAFRTERNARLPKKKKNGLVGKRSAACRAHQLILRSPRQELPGDDRGTNPPAVAGRLFCFTIRPGRLSLPSVAYEFTSIPGRVQFPFDFSLVAVTRIRARAPLPAYPYKTRVGGSRSYEVPTTRSTLPKGKRCVCQVRFFLVGLGGFDQKCYAYTQDYPSSRKLRGDYFTTTDDRP